jgi:cation diffusion facilitator family transporter
MKRIALILALALLSVPLCALAVDYTIPSYTMDVALEADGAHLTTDVLTSLGVFFGLLAVRITGLTILDPIVALAVALLILKAAWDVTKHSSLDLFDRSLPEPEQETIKTILDDRTSNEDLMVGYHDLRSRKAGSDKHVDMHVVVHRTASVAEAHDLCDDIEQQLSEGAGVRTVVLHVEPCDPNCEVCECPFPDPAGAQAAGARAHQDAPERP